MNGFTGCGATISSPVRGVFDPEEISCGKSYFLKMDSAKGILASINFGRAVLFNPPEADAVQFHAACGAVVHFRRLVIGMLNVIPQ